MKRTWNQVVVAAFVVVFLATGFRAIAQDSVPAAAPKATPAAAPKATPAAAAPKTAVSGTAAGTLTVDEAKAAEATTETSGLSDFMYVVKSSGMLGVILWLGLLATSVAGVYLCIDSYVKIRESRIMPRELLDKVRKAMDEGDVGKALEYCRAEPTILSNILRAGFENVEEGFDVIQESINAVADLESERLLQKVSYLSVVSNLAPMLGLLGTVQGMIYAFATLATQSAGAAQQAMLANNIAQALYTTAAGLVVAVPTVALFYFFRNRANNIILNMVILTNDLIKTLRNVEVVQE
jgi:biopolymer transport protein ExbB